MEAITKVDAAGRQLTTAIRLHFQQDDPIAIHTLAAAALQVLVDLAKRTGAQCLLKDERFIRPEMRGEWRKALATAENFFKHADRDPETVLEFRAEPTVFFLLDAVLLHAQLTKTLPPECNTFLIWFYAKHPNLFTDGALGEFSAEVNRVKPDPSDFAFFRTLLSAFSNADRDA